jgi:Protein of unknown function (DUF938)
MQHFALNVLKLLEEQQRQQQPQPHNVTLKWYPTDATRSSLASQLAHRDEHPDVLRAVMGDPMQLTLNETGIVEPDTVHQLDAVKDSYGGFHLMLCINMVHIAPWSATLGLFHLASQYLQDDARSSAAAALVLYGPFRVNGTMVDSNVCVYMKSQGA